MARRVLLVVLDGVGIGALPDAALYGDVGADTLLHALQAGSKVSLPFFSKLGLGNILGGTPCRGLSSAKRKGGGLLPVVANPLASWGEMVEVSKGKDTIVGHWEMMGIITEKAFPTFPHAFPPALINDFEQLIGTKTIGNLVASGTEIIKQLGLEHLRTGYPIVYTSADSVFQIACCEAVVPVTELYRYCLVARGLLTGEYGVARVIARPFEGEPGSFVRTGNRKDFVLPPPGETVLDLLQEHGVEVVALGKIVDVFSGRGISRYNHTPHNPETMRALEDWLLEDRPGFCFANFGDFDTLWGHRRLPLPFLEGLKEVDRGLAKLWPMLREDDLGIITADHGNDPTFSRHTDHTREKVPLLAYHAGKSGCELGQRSTFADMGKTVLEAFGTTNHAPGKSFLPLLT